MMYTLIAHFLNFCIRNRMTSSLETDQFSLFYLSYKSTRSLSVPVTLPQISVWAIMPRYFFHLYAVRLSVPLSLTHAHIHRLFSCFSSFLCGWNVFVTIYFILISLLLFSPSNCLLMSLSILQLRCHKEFCIKKLQIELFGKIFWRDVICCRYLKLLHCLPVRGEETGTEYYIKSAWNASEPDSYINPELWYGPTHTHTSL